MSACATELNNRNTSINTVHMYISRQCHLATDAAPGESALGPASDDESALEALGHRGSARGVADSGMRALTRRPPGPPAVPSVHQCAGSRRCLMFGRCFAVRAEPVALRLRFGARTSQVHY